MHAALIYPEFPDTFWSFRHALKFVHKKASSPPLGLLTVAAMLPKQWEKRLIDLNATKLRKGDLAWADYAFVSSMAVQRESTREVIARCKAAGVRGVAGDPLSVSEHQQFEDADHLVLNEAEVTLPPFGGPGARECQTGDSWRRRAFDGTSCFRWPLRWPSTGATSARSANGTCLRPRPPDHVLSIRVSPSR